MTMEDQDHEDQIRSQTHDPRQTSRAVDELCAVLFNVLRSPHPRQQRVRAVPNQMSPVGVALLMLGMSFALVLCGSVTFFIGFFFMPWVLGFVMLFYLAGMITNCSSSGQLFSKIPSI